LIDEGRLGEAVSHFQRAAAINPNDPFARLDLGVCFKRMGNIPAAIQNYQAALQLASERNLRATAFGNLGSIYRVAGDYPRARGYFSSALQLLPESSLALVGMGLVEQKTGNLSNAVTYYQKAVAVAPSDTTLLLLSQALAKTGQREQAQSALARAQQLSGDWSNTLRVTDHLLQQ
jgi:tetratricopeptide (TPR) repeat protein